MCADRRMAMMETEVQWGELLLGVFCLAFVTNASPFYSTSRDCPISKPVLDIDVGPNHGILESPGYSHHSSSNLDCTWHLTTSYGRVRVEALDSNMTPPGPAGCTEMAQAFDADFNVDSTPTLTNLVTWCGVTRPVFESRGRGLVLRLILNKDGGLGFHLNYSRVFDTASPIPNPCGDTRLAATTGAKYLSSPGFPNHFPENVRCVWRIYYPNGRVRLEPVSSWSGMGGFCGDYIRIYDGSSTYGGLIQTTCPYNSTTPVVSSHQYLTIEFTVQKNGTSTHGVRFRYIGVPAEQKADVPTMPPREYAAENSSCGNQFLRARVQSQYLLSPEYPRRYPRNLRCVWHISSSHNQPISVMAVNTYSRETSGWHEDYIEIYDGFNKSHPLRTWHLPTTTFSGFAVTGQDLTLKFFSSRNGIGRFRIQYVIANVTAQTAGSSETTNQGRYGIPNVNDQNARSQDNVNTFRHVNLNGTAQTAGFKETVLREIADDAVSYEAAYDAESYKAAESTATENTESPISLGVAVGCTVIATVLVCGMLYLLVTRCSRMRRSTSVRGNIRDSVFRPFPGNQEDTLQRQLCHTVTAIHRRIK